MSHCLKVPYDNLQQNYVIKGLRSDDGQALKIVCTGKHEKANGIWSTGGSGCWEFKVALYRLFIRLLDRYYVKIDMQMGNMRKKMDNQTITGYYVFLSIFKSRYFKFLLDKFFQVSGKSGTWLGLCSKDKFGAGYGMKGLFYGGPGKGDNLDN